ncbi:hypothetical protein L484_011445 [Morus notabilis]|uniref:Transmembrane protein n=1 Tax=Morus notabilis TaxID=981085 RepID=W9QTB4_9ROSA|nr:hypothetical protein L484_011445 [Morus notabilis]
MANEMKDYMRNWVEVAPDLLISRQKTSNNFTKLEPIVEEGSHEGFEVSQKRPMFLLPLLFVAVLHFFLFKDHIAF